MYGDPRALFKLFDMSYAAEPIPTSYIGVLIQASSGRMWEGVPIAAGDTDNLIEEFGNSVEWTDDILWCLKAVEEGANLVMHRIGHCTDISDRSTLDILPASVLIPDRGGVPSAGSVLSAVGPFSLMQALSGRVTGTELGPFTIVLDSNDKFKVRLGVPGAWGAEQTVTLSPGVGRTAQQVCDDINAGTNGLNATVAGGKIYLEAVSVTDDVEILAVTNDAYSALGFVAGVSAHAPGTDGLIISVDGAADQVFNLEPLHGELSQFALTSAEVVAQLTALTGATLSSAQGKVKMSSNTTGVNSSIQIKAGSTAAAALGLDTVLHSGAAGAVKNPWKFVLKGPGAYGNGAKVYVYDNPLNPGTGMNVRITVPGKKEEYFSNLVRDPNSSRYWKAYINAHSNHGTIVDTIDVPNAAPNDWPALSQTGYALTGGDDGTLVLTDADWVGDPAGKTGFYCTDHWQMPFIDIMIPGTSSAAVKAEFEAFIKGRKGRMGWMPTPPGMNAEETVAWRMGDPDKGYSHAAFNLWKCASYKGRFTVYDPKNNEKREISGLAFLAADLCKTDQGQGRHISPFGIKRGQAHGVLGIDFNPAEKPGDADLLAEYQINNARILRTSIETRGLEGAYSWGGWTDQREFSALRENPVSRKILEYEWMLYPVGLSYVNDPNHPVTWREVYRILNPIFRHDLDAGAIYGYALACDQDAFFTAEGEVKGAYLNTGPTIDQGLYRCRILIQPVRQIFYFVFEMGVMRTGEPFTNYQNMFSFPGWLKQAA